MSDFKILAEIFSTYNPIKQVIVYAEAIRAERYELLHYIKTAIPEEGKEEFLKAVDLWLKEN